MWHVGSLFSDQGLKLHPLHWKHRFLTTGLPLPKSSKLLRLVITVTLMSNCIHILNNLALRDKYCHYSHHPYFAWGNQGTEDVATTQGLTLVRRKAELDHTDLVPETQQISDFLMTRFPSGTPTAVPEFLLLPQVLVIQSCLTLCDPMDCSLPGSSIHGICQARNTKVGCHFLLQGIFPTQESNPGLPHCRQVLHRLSHQGSLLSHNMLLPHIPHGVDELHPHSLQLSLCNMPSIPIPASPAQDYYEAVTCGQSSLYCPLSSWKLLQAGAGPNPSPHAGAVSARRIEGT